jgi:hypothetical protein
MISYALTTSKRSDYVTVGGYTGFEEHQKGRESCAGQELLLDLPTQLALFCKKTFCGRFSF